MGDGRRFPLQFDCQHCQMNVLKPRVSSPHPGKLLSWVVVLVCMLLMPSCGHRPVTQPRSLIDTLTMGVDTLAFSQTHHYARNYNFRVSADTLLLTTQLPEEAVSGLAVDSVPVMNDRVVVVADIRVLPADTVDSVWIQLAQDDLTSGWVRECDMLKSVTPDDPVSRFIMFFSNRHHQYFLLLLIVLILGHTVSMMRKRQAYIVHFRDIDTFYPTLLSVTVAVSATVYSYLQQHDVEVWRHFYFHPLLNPLVHPLPLAIFLITVWGILVLAIASIDDTFRHLPAMPAVVYLLGLLGVCAFNYLFFSTVTHSVVGYLLLVAYVAFAFYQYFARIRAPYVCGHCGRQIRSKGRCPHCGAVNE